MKKLSALFVLLVVVTAFAVGEKPILMVIPDVKKGLDPLDVVNSNNLTKASMEAINAYLIDKGYEVKTLEGSDQLKKAIQLQSDIAYEGEDIAYTAGLSLGAEVYIKFQGQMNENMVNMEVSAYEASTARLLGSQSAMVKNNGPISNDKVTRLFRTAAKKAMPLLEKKILGFWAEEQKKGAQYKVVIRVGEDIKGSDLENVQEATVNVARSNFKQVKVNSMTDKTIDLTVYADPDKIPDAIAVYSNLKQALSASGTVKKNNIANRLIIMELQ
ncbi:MAG: hypothetical protein HUK20_09410 [Fibrobacter sp.]|nr:hypothetical protein [Fibrobacter sp.]